MQRTLIACGTPASQMLFLTSLVATYHELNATLLRYTTSINLAQAHPLLEQHGSRSVKSIAYRGEDELVPQTRSQGNSLAPHRLQSPSAIALPFLLSP